MDQMKYLKELAVRYPNVAAASTEIINLQAILHLPKGTEHYVSDVHGEYEKFSHIIRNGSGAIRSRIEDEFGNTLTTEKSGISYLLSGAEDGFNGGRITKEFPS